MNPAFALTGGFFLLILALVGGGGYWYLQRREESDAEGGNLLAGTLQAVGEAVPTRDSQISRYRQMLVYAGYRQPEALTIFFGAKAAASGLCALLAILFSLLFGEGGLGWLTAGLAGAGMGYLLTDQALSWRIRSRADRLKRSLPLALELLVLGLEGGQSLDGAMMDTARELRNSHPDIAAELGSVPMSLLSTRSRQDQLRQLIDRNTEPEIKRFAQVLIDSDRFGTSLAGALRNQTRYLRTNLRQSAQEQARKVSVKLVFPVFFLIFPAVLLVTLGPAVLQLMGSLESGFGGVIK
jgi:tight adherence protein C